MQVETANEKEWQKKQKFSQSKSMILGMVGIACTVVLITGFFLAHPHNSQPQDPVEKSFGGTHVSELGVIVSNSIVLPYKEIDANLEDKDEMLHYLYCQAAEIDERINQAEILMLHGAAFTAETWRSSGILQKLCENGIEHSIRSVIALDLSVSADGAKLAAVYDRLREESIISGNSLILVTPSASGKSVVTMAEKAITDSRYANYLRQIFRGWVPVACPAIQSTSEEALKRFIELSIPVMAVYGSKDSMGKTVSEKLKTFAGGSVHEIYGSHPCYLDSPNEFIGLIKKFIKET